MHVVFDIVSLVSLFFTPRWPVVESFEADACLVSISTCVTSHFAVWGYVLYRMFADARHLGRPHTLRSFLQAFAAFARPLSTRAPAVRPFL